MTTTLQIPREAWRSYFAELTDVLGTVEATVEVVGRDVGDQVEDERLILTDMNYDDESDTIHRRPGAARFAGGTDRASDRAATARPTRDGRTSAA